MYLLINFFAFQIGWFVCVLGAANSIPLLGPVIVAAVIAMHLSQSNKPVRELALTGVAGLLGAFWERAVVMVGWIEYPSGNIAAGFAPYWIVAMWMLFATTLNVSLRWLRNRTALAVVLGAIAGPLSFYGGAQLGGVVFLDQRAGLIALSVGWAVMMPTLIILAARLDGIAVPIVGEQARV